MVIWITGLSGAGKTSLLDILACNTAMSSSDGTIDGNVMVNGVPR